MPQYSLHEAKTHLPALVGRAAAGEAIIITRNGVPKAQLTPIAQRRVPANGRAVVQVANDFDAPDLRIEAMFGEIG